MTETYTKDYVEYLLAIIEAAKAKIKELERQLENERHPWEGMGH